MDLFYYKNHKKGVSYSHGTHEADLAWREHVVEPRKATWTRGHIHGPVDIVGLAFDGPMGIVGPGKMGSIQGPCWQCNGSRRLTIYPIFSLNFFHLGLLCSFSSDVASCGASDEIAQIYVS